jgi:aldehyde:ferredoxin oxidoreductase
MEPQVVKENNQNIYGYAGKILRVDLSTGKSSSQILEETSLKKFLGGATLGIKYLYDEVAPHTQWSDPENRIFLGSGPLNGTRVGGSGCIAIVTKGPLTNGIASSQANGFLGAYLRFAGYDALIVQGAAINWTYIYIHGDKVEFKDASHLIGKSSLEVENILKEELHKNEREVSILSIGVAGENLVKFACPIVDGGHMAAHNGIGAVFGSKKVKAIVIERSVNNIPIKDSQALSNIAKAMLTNVQNDKMGALTLREGTIGMVVMGTASGTVPVKNYTTNVHVIDPDKLNAYSSSNIRSNFNIKPSPCWACTAHHCHNMEITKGKYAGRKFEEPEFEAMSAFSALVGVSDMPLTVLLASETDRLGMDVNETGWVISWVIECFEKKILTINDTDGLAMRWGDGDAIMAMLNKIAYRQGFGNVLAEGVMRASQQVGKESSKLAVYTMKGNTPRSHDHRVVWWELFDTCVSNLGTLEAHQGAPFKLLGLPDKFDKFDPVIISTLVAKAKGAMVFEDSLVACRFNTSAQLDLDCQAINASTGWNMNIEDAMNVGRRAVNLARSFNLLHGIGPELDVPSIRYGSTPLDGQSAGRGVMQYWDTMIRNYYNLMGWDEKTSKPLPETLKQLDLDFVIPRLW